MRPTEPKAKMGKPGFGLGWRRSSSLEGSLSGAVEHRVLRLDQHRRATVRRSCPVSIDHRDMLPLHSMAAPVQRVPAGGDRGTMRRTVSETMTVSQHRWSRAEYDRAVEAGVFGPDARLELIEGAILAMGPQGSEHFTGIELVVDALRAAFGAGYRVRTQGPLAAGEDSEPEPDVAVVAGDARSYRDAHPSSALLVVEVSDHSLHRDRTVKQRLYARLRHSRVLDPRPAGATSGDLPRPGCRRLSICLDPPGR